MKTHVPHTVDTATSWCNRNGTYVRILIINPPPPRERRRLDDVDIHLERLIVLVAPSVDTLNEQTATLRHLATAEGIELVSADGHHAALLTRIAAANSARR